MDDVGRDEAQRAADQWRGEMELFLAGQTPPDAQAQRDANMWRGEFARFLAEGA